MSDAKTLLELQRCDSGIARLRKDLDELPEIKAIMECRAKRKEIKGKQDQVVEHLDEVEQQLSRLQDEEEQVIAKMTSLQEKLDSNADYRETASITSDMEAQVNRQKSIAQAQEQLLERQIKIDGLAEQVTAALAKIDHAEEHHTAQFKQKGSAIKAEIDALEKQRAALIAQLDEPTAKRYEQLRAEKNGVAVSQLEDDHCTACRSIILDGVLAKLRKGPEVAECPNCHRIMIVQASEEEQA